jgi:SNF2 family DNA or RNA helicase
LGACLADDMGLGKTIQLIALLLSERERAASLNVQTSNKAPATPSPSSILNSPSSPRIGPTLLFAPTSVVGNWLRELQRFAQSLKVMVHHGAERLTGDTFAREAQSSDVVITSYSLAHRDKDEFSRVHWHRIVLDEAQKIKNPAAAATIAIRDVYAPRRIAMTGTPIENHLSELWSIMQVLNPGLLGTAADFREKFAVPIEKLGEKSRAEQLRRMIRPFILRRTKQDPTIAGDLPEKLEMKVFCNLTAEQAALYEHMVNDSLRQIDSASGIRRRGLILATLTRLKQICNHPALLEENTVSYDTRSGKCERLVDMLEELLEEGDACLIFTQYREMGHILEKMIKARLNAATFFLHGGTPAKGRDDMIQAFQEQKGAPRIFILSLRAGGLGLNLTAANHVFHFDRWWNPAVEAQATDRAHRVGQTRTVQVHKFVCIGTMEERIDKLLSEKQALADQIVGSGDEWLTGLSTDQLRDYLSLSKEAVGEFE